MAASEQDTLDLSARLEQGWALPAQWYSDPSILEIEREVIFRPAWRFGGLLKDVAEPGQFMTRTVGNTPVVIVRGRDGELRAFVNVCRHRGAAVASGCGHATTLQCPYHAWTYDLDGSLRAAPRSDREPSFDKDELGLMPVRVDTWGPVVFVNLDADAPPLLDALGVLPDALARTGVDFGSLSWHSSTPFDMSANWKVVAENYLECYHCAVAHPGFTKLVETGPDDYELRVEGNVLIAESPLRPNPGADAPKMDTTGVVPKTFFDLVWPSTTFNVFGGPSNLLLYFFEPVTTGRTYGEFHYFFGDDADAEYREDLIRFFDEVGNEDLQLVESVQAGLESGAVPNGRLMPDTEFLIQTYQRRVYEALTG
ncbi:MAG: choline monooxygenase [Solirubrobacteraceae bacterium]|jgi:choline monooxygenase|nr:choline monooxygenase [Solirubrobacteraceae bacterium]